MILLDLFNYPCIVFFRCLYSVYLAVKYPSVNDIGKKLIYRLNFDKFMVESPLITTIFSIMFYNILIKIIW